MNTFFYDSYQLILVFLIPGFLLGGVYDVFRVIRIARTNPENNIFSSIREHFKWNVCVHPHNAKKREFILVFVEDFVFCTIAAISEILLFYHLNNGVIRIYAILLSVIGFLIYHISIGRIVIGLTKQIVRITSHTLYYVLIILLTPIMFIYKNFCKMRKKSILTKDILKKRKERLDEKT